MVKYFWLTLFALVLLASCAKDIILSPPTELVGVYDAYFYYTEDYGSSTAKTIKVKLNWNFLSDKAFNYSVDNEDPFTDPDNSVCDVSSGEYSRATVNDISFSKVVAGVGSVCDIATLVNGTFTFKTVEDTIEIAHYIPEQSLNFIIKMVKITQ